LSRWRLNHRRFVYFPNYIWNLSVAIALESGGQIGEIVDMCQPIKDAAPPVADAGTPPS
jgi:hypothetical protein